MVENKHRNGKMKHLRRPIMKWLSFDAFVDG
jgi:hypothetical protein